MKRLRIGAPGAESPAALVTGGRYVDLSDVVDDYDERFVGTGGVDRIRPVIESRAESGQSLELGDQRVGAPIVTGVRRQNGSGLGSQRQNVLAPR